ncbi:hypothetical protein [Couchioplanes azureus]|uniref:hypothetical protein n=1 Tax=Couchioplanes caeruleus TaxID=56438 RepID=UPI00166FBC31|nr:hypothetical protein [Couchioplanes caeruleus]GGQ72640.1 hypothetical protein GCM10010166_48270 [Couchioplanes caeruleus subsp. azureus]
MIQTAIDPAGPAAVPRPTTVTAAFACQVALVGTLLLITATAVAQAVRYNALIGRAARTVGASPADVSAERAMNLSSTLAIAVPLVVLAVWLGLAAVGVRRGSNVARILSVVGVGMPLALGLLVCVLGGLLGSVLAVGLLAGPPDDSFAEDDSGFVVEEFASDGEIALYEEMTRLDTGGWSTALDVIGTTVGMLALLLGAATAILLLIGPSDRHFRPRRWVPPPTPPAAPWPAPGYPLPPPHPWYGGPALPYPPHPGPSAAPPPG